MPIVRIRTEQKVRYDREVEVTDEELEQMKEACEGQCDLDQLHLDPQRDWVDADDIDGGDVEIDVKIGEDKWRSAWD